MILNFTIARDYSETIRIAIFGYVAGAFILSFLMSLISPKFIDNCSLHYYSYRHSLVLMVHSKLSRQEPYHL